MNKLQSILYHNKEDNDMTMNVEFIGNEVIFTINWWVNHDGVKGVRGESVIIGADQAYYLARDILARCHDPMILEDNLAALD
jgi:hypothetical protein